METWKFKVYRLCVSRGLSGGEYRMKHNPLLTITSLLSLLLFTFHMSEDVVRGMEPGGLSNLIGGVLISVVWLYVALALAERRPEVSIRFEIGTVIKLNQDAALEQNGEFVPDDQMPGIPLGNSGGVATSIF